MKDKNTMQEELLIYPGMFIRSLFTSVKKRIGKFVVRVSDATVVVLQLLA